MLSLLMSAAMAFSIVDEAKTYKDRYGVNSPDTKITDNRGRGREYLYGTRNMRSVLHGVMYRGGANNVYFSPPRDNRNPLTKTGLVNLCREGFGSSIYLYSTNFHTAPKTVYCESTPGEVDYLQIDPYNKTEKILDLVHKRIKGQLEGPIYAHCWNGWHYSGLISAIALKQFCGYSSDQALSYWIRNTDGNSKGYESIKTKIKNFKPDPRFQITAEEQSAICM